MKLFTRLFVAITVVALYLHYAPLGYWMLFAGKHRPPFVAYSCVARDFVMLRVADGEVAYADAAGRTLTRDEFEALLPFQYAGQLVQDGRMPAEIDGVVLEPRRFGRERTFLKVEPADLDNPTPNLRPLFESASGRVELEQPADFLRLGAAAEFLVAGTNEPDPAKSARFTGALVAAGFRFPARVVASNPTTRKAYEEGVYALDSAGALFHLVLRRGEPLVERVAARMAGADAAQLAALDIARIVVQEQPNRVIRALLLTRDDAVWALCDEACHLHRLPLGEYRRDRDELMVRGDLLNFVVTVRNDERIEVVALDRGFQPVGRHAESLTTDAQSRAGRIAAWLFPRRLVLDNERSGYLGLHLE